MAIDFPSAPNVNDTHTDAGLTWVWTGEKWTTNGNDPAYQDVFVNKSGDDMSGNLTLGTDKIELDATDGSASFKGQVTEATAYTTTGYDSTGGKGAQLTSAGSVYCNRPAGEQTASVFAGKLDGVITAKIQASGDVTTVGDIQSTSQNGGALAGFRNHIINGGMDIWQRGTSFSSSGADGRTFFADRWSHRGTNGSGGTTDVTQVTYKFGHVTRATLAGHTSDFYMETKLEAGDVRKLAGKQVTFSCFMTTAAPGFYAETYDSSDTVASITNSVVAMTSLGNNMYSYTFMVPDIVIGSSSTVVGLTLRVYTNGGNTSSNGGYDFGQSQLELGPVATPFEHRPIQTELAMCQRYAYRFNWYGTRRLYIHQHSASTGLDTKNVQLTLESFSFPTSMRATPTASTVDSQTLLAEVRVGVFDNQSNTTGASFGTPTAFGGRMLTPDSFNAYLTFLAGAATGSWFSEQQNRNQLTMVRLVDLDAVLSIIFDAEL